MISKIFEITKINKKSSKKNSHKAEKSLKNDSIEQNYQSSQDSTLSVLVKRKILNTGKWGREELLNLYTCFVLFRISKLKWKNMKIFLNTRNKIQIYNKIKNLNSKLENFLEFFYDSAEAEEIVDMNIDKQISPCEYSKVKNIIISIINFYMKKKTNSFSNINKLNSKYETENFLEDSKLPQSSFILLGDTKTNCTPNKTYLDCDTDSFILPDPVIEDNLKEEKSKNSETESQLSELSFCSFKQKKTLNEENLHADYFDKYNFNISLNELKSIPLINSNFSNKNFSQIFTENNLINISSEDFEDLKKVCLENEIEEKMSYYYTEKSDKISEVVKDEKTILINDRNLSRFLMNRINSILSN